MEARAKAAVDGLGLVVEGELRATTRKPRSGHEERGARAEAEGGEGPMPRADLGLSGLVAKSALLFSLYPYVIKSGLA